MTTFQKSKLLWIGGGIVGGLVAALATQSGPKTLAGAAIGDKVLEQEQRTGVFSLLPLGR